jgi:hypothetical protein
MKRLLIAVFLLTGCSSIEEKAQHNQAQIEIVRVQRDAQRAERLSEAEAKKALFEALAAVAQANPDQAGAVTVALAIQGLGGDDNADSTPIIGLQASRNEALEWAQALAPVAGGVISTVGTAIISGNVQKRQIEATRDVQINQANQTANAIAAVADLGTAAVANVGDSIAGDYYSLTGSTIDNSTTTTTTSTAISDSYNTTDNSDNSTVDNSVSTTNNDYSTVTYEGQEFTLPNLLSYLQGTGLAYSIQIGDTTYTVDGDGDPVTIDCGKPDFSPSPPQCG